MVLRYEMIVAIRRGPLGAHNGAANGLGVRAVSSAGRGGDMRPATAAGMSHDWQPPRARTGAAKSGRVNLSDQT